MQPREKILAIALLAVVGFWFGRPMVESVLFEPIRDLERQEKALKKKWETTETQELKLFADLKQLAEWESLALPDEAMDAQRIYGAWLLSELERIGWQEVSMTPGRRVPIGKTADAVQVNLEGQATPAQFSQFIRLFEETPLLHRIERMTQDVVSSSDREILSIVLTAEGICISGKTARPWPFERWELASDFDAANAKSLEVVSSDLKPKQKLSIRLNEAVYKIKVDEKQTTIWHIEKRPETATQLVVAGSLIAPEVAFETENDPQAAMNAWLAQNPFFEPTPPAPFRPQFTVPGTLDIVRGTQGEERFQLSGLGDLPYDTLDYQLQAELPEFVQIDQSTGTIRWNFPAEAEMPESVKTTAVATIDSLFFEQPYVLNQPIQVVFRDPNTAPAVEAMEPLMIPSDQQWTFDLQATDNDQPQQQLSYSLTGTVPEGLSVSSANGQLQWTPTTEQEGEEFTVQVQVTDDGQPPLSGTASVKLSVVHNAEKSIELVACITADERRRAWFVDRKTGKRYAIAEGEKLAVGLFASEVLEIRQTEVLLESNEEQSLLKLGQKLQQRRTISKLTQAPQAVR